jgi:lysophospholipase L1-like esterase
VHIGEVTATHPWTRYVAIGDSFTEGIGDPEPAVPGGHRGWADRVAEVLSEGAAGGPDGFAYANLAIRGRLLQRILDEQVEAALELRPDLITISAGGNDVIRPGSDPDEITARYETGLARLVSGGATVVVFTGPDPGRTPVLGRVRGKAAIYNENVRALARRYGARVADLWAVAELRDPRMWAPDRLHFSPIGHHTIARLVLDVLEVPNALEPFRPEPLPAASWRRATRENIDWAREYFVPWIGRRLTGRSSGDGVHPKRPVPRAVR